MGIIRFFLALVVVSDHAGPIFGIHPAPGYLAVQAFYIISGFYMQMVLLEKYRDGRVEFYISRALRLFPIYWIVLVATLLGALFLPGFGPIVSAFKDWHAQYSALSGGQVAAAVVANLTLIGQDWLHFLSLAPDGSLMLEVRHYDPNGPFNLGRLVVVPQAWTLGVEIAFYLVAPWLAARSWRVLLAVAAASLAARFVAAQYGLVYDPWLYRFFPFELVFFVGGMLAYRGYAKISKGIVVRAIGVAGAAAVIWFAANYWSIFPDQNDVAAMRLMPAKHWLLLGLVAGFLPFIFAATSDWRLDRMLGELSYPVYVSHFLVMQILVWANLVPASGKASMVAAASTAVSLALLWLVSPIDRWRHNIPVFTGRRHQIWPFSGAPKS